MREYSEVRPQDSRAPRWIRGSGRRRQSQEKSGFLDSGPSFRSGKEGFYITVQTTLPTSASNSVTSYLGMLPIQEDFTLNAFLQQHRCERHSHAFSSYSLQQGSWEDL